MVYSVPEGLSAATYKTGSGDNAGQFSIKAGQTAKFDLLAAGYKYLVKEFGLTKEYTEVITDSGYYKQIDVLSQASSDTGSGEAGTGVEAGTGAADTEDTDADTAAGADSNTSVVSGEYAQVAGLNDSGLSFLFTNHYEAKKINLNLTKADEEGNVITDAPAHFMLYLDREQKQPVYEDAYIATDDKGKLTFLDLKPGTYWLYELKAPSGYRLLESPIEIHIGWGADGSPVVTIDGKPLSEDSDVVTGGHIESGTVQDSQDTQNGQDTQEGQNTQDSQNVKSVTTVNDTICITVINSDFYKLPSSGGSGIYWYSIGGMLLMMAASLILYRNKHRGRC